MRDLEERDETFEVVLFQPRSEWGSQVAEDFGAQPVRHAELWVSEDPNPELAIPDHRWYL